MSSYEISLYGKCGKKLVRSVMLRFATLPFPILLTHNKLFYVFQANLIDEESQVFYQMPSLLGASYKQVEPLDIENYSEKL